MKERGWKGRKSKGKEKKEEKDYLKAPFLLHPSGLSTAFIEVQFSEQRVHDFQNLFTYELDLRNSMIYVTQNCMFTPLFLFLSCWI
jgi:hypothetical protein